MPTASEPLISVVIPAYNAGKTLERTMRSVMTQHYRNWELIVVDDGSKDDTAEIISRLAAEDDRIKPVLGEPNVGQAGAINKGLDRCQGEWISLLDADDEYLPHRLSVLVASAAKDPEIDVVVHKHILVLPNGTERVRGHAWPEPIPHDKAVALAAEAKITPFPWDKMARRSAVGDYRLPGIRRQADLFWSVAVVAGARKTYCIPDALTRYNVDFGSNTWSAFSPIEWIDDVQGAVREGMGDYATTPAGKRALRVSWTADCLLCAHQGAMNKDQQLGMEHAKKVADLISIDDIVASFRDRTVFGPAAVMLKLNPTLYSKLYRAMVRRQYAGGALSASKG